MNARAQLLFLPPGAVPDAPWVGIPISREELIREYYGGDIPSIEERVDRRLAGEDEEWLNAGFGKG
jgi:uncharacterized protein with HEPN domain